MDFTKKRRKWNLRKLLLPTFLIAITCVVLLKFFFPPSPESVGLNGESDRNGKDAGASFLKQPVSFAVNTEMPPRNRNERGGFFLRLDTPGHTNRITDLLFFDQGKLLLSASLDGTIRVWQVERKNKPVLISTIRGMLSKFINFNLSLEEMRDSYGRIHALALSGDGTYLASAASSRVRLYNLRRGRMIGVFNHHSGEVTDLAFSADGKYLASSANDGSVLIYDLVRIRDFDEKSIDLSRDQLKFMKRLAIKGGPVLEVSFSKDGLAALSQDGSLDLYLLRDFSCIANSRDPRRTVTCAGFSHDGKYLLAGTDDRGLVLLSSRGQKLRDFSTLSGIPRKLCFSADDRQVLISCSNETGGGSLHCFSFPDGMEIKEFPAKNRPIGAIASASRDGSAWWASADNAMDEISIWDENGEKYCTISPGALLVKNVQLSPDGMIGLGILGDQDEARRFIPVSSIFDAKKLQLRPLSANDRLNGALPAVEQMSLITTGTSRSNLDILNDLLKMQINRDGEPVGQILSGPLNGEPHYSCTFAGKQLLVCGGRDGLLLAYDLQGNLVGRLSGPEGDILSLAGDAAKPLVVASSSDHVVRMWDLSQLEIEVKNNTVPGGYMPNIIKVASGIMSGLGAYKKEAAALPAEMSRLFLENVEGWQAAGQYLSLFRMDLLKKIDPAISLALFQDNEWLAWLPQGYVSLSSPAVMKYFGYQADYISYKLEDLDENLKYLPFDRFYDKMFRPDLVKLAVTDSEQFRSFIYANKADDFFYEALVLNPPPEVDILAPANGRRLNARALAVKVKIKDTGGGIGDVRIYHNGKLVSSKGVFRAYRSVTATGHSLPVEEKSVVSGPEFYKNKGDMESAITVQLVPGKNTISCAAMNYHNTVMSAMKFSDVVCSMPERQPRLFCLSVGNNNFQNPAINLVFTHFDALGVAEMLRQNGKRYFSDVTVKTMLDPKKEKLLEVLKEWQAQMDPLDTFIFYVSSHGALVDDRFCLVTADCDGSELNSTNSIGGDELMADTMKMPALQQVIILDTCFAGSSSWVFNDLYETRLQQFSLGSGLHILSACSPYEYSAEGYNQHGVFSYYLIKALSGDADYFGNKDGRVSVLEASRYIREQIKSSPVEFQSQSPMLSEYGKDVILVDRHK